VEKGGRPRLLSRLIAANNKFFSRVNGAGEIFAPGKSYLVFAEGESQIFLHQATILKKEHSETEKRLEKAHVPNKYGTPFRLKKGEDRHLEGTNLSFPAVVSETGKNFFLVHTQ